MMTGSLVALVTPMLPDGSLDLGALRRLIDFHVEAGTNGLVIVGTTGESPTVDFEEHHLLIRTAIEHAAGRVKIVAGTGANSTKEAIELTAYAKAQGADAVLSVVPYYNKPTQEGLYQHFKAIAEAVEIPVILYNVPGRTVCDMSNDTALRLAQVPNIVGMKDATGGIERGTDLINRAPAGFAVYSGDDATALALMLLGGHGVISVTANVVPALMRQMCDAAFAGEVARAREINQKIFALHQKLFVEANPIPAKWALAQMGLIQDAVRLPLTPLSAAGQAVVRAAMQQTGVVAA